MISKRTRQLSLYMGGKMLWSRSGKETEIDITPMNLHLTQDYPEGEIKALLKSVGYITDNDLKIISSSNEFELNIDYIRTFLTNEVIDGDLCKLDMDVIDAIHVIDKSRKLGYAIGIDKEFYTIRK